MDEQIQRTERDAAAGDPEAAAAWLRLCARRGLYFRDFPRKDEDPTEWEEAQKDYDDLWWHGNTPRKCGLWGVSGFQSHSHRRCCLPPNLFLRRRSCGISCLFPSSGVSARRR